MPEHAEPPRYLPTGTLFTVVKIGAKIVITAAFK
jgi:hypothetical protein